MGKTIAMIFGWILVIIGLLGFIPNPIVGTNGLFLTDTMHNIVHLISGIILLWASYKAASKVRTVLTVLGIVYLLIAILGFFMSGGMVLGMMTNTADNWLHVVFGIVFIWAGMKASKAGVMSSSSTQPMM